eukprot:1162730-Rhodomonas_salina.3
MIVNHRDRSEPPRSESCQTERQAEVRVCTASGASGAIACQRIRENCPDADVGTTLKPKRLDFRVTKTQPNDHRYTCTEVTVPLRW